MRKRITLCGLTLAICAVAATYALNGAEHHQPKIKDFMQAKLAHSQKTLEGLALGDFEMIVKHSQEMSLLTLAETWQVMNTPDYIQYSNDFRRATDSMTEAAKKKNLDGAALAYVQVTMQCINCHKYVRGVHVARHDR